MVGQMANLTVKTVSAIKEKGLYGDGGGLYMRVGPTGSKSWILRTLVHGKRREFGLGSVRIVSLSEAREEARRLRKIARKGGDPEAVRKRESLTFEQAARRVLATREGSWKNPGHAKRWIASLEAYAFPLFGNRQIDTIATSDVLRAITPIWTEKHDTAKRVKQRIGVVFDWAKASGNFPMENPVNGLKGALPTIKARPVHMKSLPWRELPEFMGELSGREGVSARALEFIILTCARPGEVRGARWSEIDGGVWIVPAERMKGGIEHRVPLSEPAQAALAAVRGLDHELVFPSVQRAHDGAAKPMSDVVFKALTKRMGRTGFTTHGFRSTFRDWCSESARVDRELAEMALAHKIGNKVEQAYARSDLFERRREVMDAWGRFATGQSGQVVELVRA